jgi:hypothetical protein
MDEKDAGDAAGAVGRGEHPNQLKGDLRLLRDLRLPPPLPEDLDEQDQPGQGDEPVE